MKLCNKPKYTITNYKFDILTKNKVSIAEFISNRFKECYINAVKGESKNGFSIMAVSCLMIEALETFHQGWKDSRNRSQCCFISFFSHCRQLNIFKPYDLDFYQNIRCGILHQAETKNGWKIRRSGDLLNPKLKIINATKFLKKLEEYLSEHSQNLKNSDWNDEIWINFRTKMDAVIENCKR